MKPTTTKCRKSIFMSDRWFYYLIKELIKVYDSIEIIFFIKIFILIIYI